MRRISSVRIGRREMTQFTTTVNGEPATLELDGHESAVDVVREQLGLTGTKLVCAGGVCGACTMQIDGTPVVGCLTPATALRDSAVTTVEGLADGDDLHPVQRAFMAHDGLQCGYCTPGFVVDAAAFVDEWREVNGPSEPDRHTIADALAGHLCRCGAYEGIYRAVAGACRGEHDEPGPSARVDAEAKVTGAAVYTADVFPTDALHAVIVRSPVAAADVGPTPTDAAPWVVDLLGEHRSVTYAGQPIAAVAAESLSEARRLASEFPIEIVSKPFVTDPAAARLPGAPAVHADKADRRAAPNAAEGVAFPARWSGNVRGPVSVRYRGMTANRRIERARSNGDPGLAELELGTGVQLHTSFEPHCTVADWSDPDKLVMWTSTQALNHVHEELAEHYELDATAVEIHADFVGGGFGSKLGVTPDMHGAIQLSKVSRRPVRLVLDRREELTATGNRPGSASDISLLVGDDGSFEAMVMDGEAHGGSAINGAYGILAALTYRRAPKLTRDRDILTNTPPGAPFRGPGGPTAAWALESAVDQAAHQTGRDPLELRRTLDRNPKRIALYDWARDLDVWRSRPATGSEEGRFRRGVGVAAANWVYNLDPATEIEVAVHDGRLVVSTASQDMGTGSKTVLANAVAEVFDTEAGDVVVRMGLADGVRPHGPVSGGSRTTPSIWSTTIEAAEKLKAEIGSVPSSEHDGMHVRVVRAKDSRRGLRMNLPTSLEVGRGFSGALHVSEVEVDTLTGKVRVLTVFGGIAVGRIHSPLTARNQCEGSIIQGIGLALYEQQVIDPHTGLTLTSNLEDYRIPQLGDTPEIHIHFHEEGWDHVPGGGVGLGEVATVSPAASVGNAIFNATGWRPTHLPIRPDRVLEGLR
ncbi:MAG: molybdopterin-dependent oxidoreductase [Actinomycetota bacterium]